MLAQSKREYRRQLLSFSVDTLRKITKTDLVINFYRAYFAELGLLIKLSEAEELLVYIYP